MITLSSSDFFLLPERQAVLVRLPTFDWDFTLGLSVRLRAGGRSLDARQIGTGNHEGRATILLSPADWSAAETELRSMIGTAGPIVLEKGSS